MSTRRTARARRHMRIRSRVAGTAERPRLAVFRSARHISAQLIDDRSGRTVLSASDHDIEKRKGTAGKSSAIEIAAAVGEIIGKRAQEAGIHEVVFDRGGFSYHGRIRALAEGARKAGLKF